MPNNALHPKLSVAARCSALCAASLLFIVPLLDEWLLLNIGKGRGVFIHKESRFDEEGMKSSFQKRTYSLYLGSSIDD